MTLYQILNLYITNTVNTSLFFWSLNAENVKYRELIEFFQKEINIQELLRKAWESIFTITEGWIIIDEIVLEKSKVGKYKKVKKRYKSAGGYITPAISVVLIIWSNGVIRVPIGFRIRGEESHIDTALGLLSWLRNKMKFKPLYVSFDAGFASKKLLKRIDDYGWIFVCRIPKTRKFEGIQIWRYKKQGFWNNCGILWCGIKVRAVRRKDKFYVCNRLNWNAKIIENCYKQRAVIEEVFRLLKGVCHWKRCQFAKDERYECFLTFGIFTFMVWEFNRIHYPDPITIYKLRRNVILGNFNVSIPDLDWFVDYA